MKSWSILIPILATVVMSSDLQENMDQFCAAKADDWAKQEAKLQELLRLEEDKNNEAYASDTAFTLDMYNKRLQSIQDRLYTLSSMGKNFDKEFCMREVHELDQRRD